MRLSRAAARAAPTFVLLVRRRLRAALATNVVVTDPPAAAVAEWDVPVVVRDGTRLRVNIFRPPGDGPFPVLLSAHPYGKDRLPRRVLGRYRPLVQYRAFRQPEVVRTSAWTGWEAPDPAFWVARGYAVLNADLRGFGTSEGTGVLFSDQEAEDYFDLIEWAGTQAWSNGKVGLDGVSYLAISQYKVAALQPPHLAAICPWEGLTDFYRDFARPGGIAEDGFIVLWNTLLRRAGRTTSDLRAEEQARPLFDAWYASLRPHLEQIQVPALVCASFSDHSLHSRGAFEAFRRLGSPHKWLYTHRGGKWSTYYGEEASAARERFFGWALKGEDSGQERTAAVRLEVRDRGDAAHAVRHEPAFPPPTVTWQRLALDPAAGRLAEGNPTRPTSAAFETRKGAVSFAWSVPYDLDVIGPMALRLWIEVRGADDAHLFAGVRKFRDGREVRFEGSYGFERDLVTKGWLVASHREADPALSLPGMPVHAHRERCAFDAGEIAPVDIALLPSATHFRAGDVLRLDVQGHWFFARDPLRGQFPAWYEPGPRCTVVLYGGEPYEAHLLLPITQAVAGAGARAARAAGRRTDLPGGLILR